MTLPAATARDYNQIMSQRPQPAKRAASAVKQRPQPHRHPRHKAQIICGLLVAFALGMLLTSQAALLSAKGYQLAGLQQEIQELQVKGDRMQLEVNKLKSLDRIEMIAISQMGMRRPTDGDWELLPEVGGQLVVAGLNPTPVAQVETASNPSSRLSRLAATIERLLGIGQVHASEL